jgi:transposase-like protein
MPLTPSESRRRRIFTDAFKADAVAACQHPGVSIAAIAMARQLNANLLRRWVKEAGGELPSRAVSKTPTPARLPPPPGAPPALVPVKVQASDSVPHTDIRVEIQRAGTTINISWPLTESAACAQWLREVLR